MRLRSALDSNLGVGVHYANFYLPPPPRTQRAPLLNETWFSNGWKYFVHSDAPSVAPLSGPGSPSESVRQKTICSDRLYREV